MTPIGATMMMNISMAMAGPAQLVMAWIRFLVTQAIVADLMNGTTQIGHTEAAMAEVGVPHCARSTLKRRAHLVLWGSSWAVGRPATIHLTHMAQATLFLMYRTIFETCHGPMSTNLMICT